MATLSGIFRTTIAYQALGSNAWEPMFTQTSSGTPLVYIALGNIYPIAGPITTSTTVFFINLSTKGTVTWQSQVSPTGSSGPNRNLCPIRPSSRNGFGASMAANKVKVMTASSTYIDAFSSNPKPGDTNLASGTQSAYGTFPSSIGSTAFGLCNSTRAIFGPPLQYIEIASGGTASSFGTLNNSRQTGASAASTTRGIIAGGMTTSGSIYVSDIDYITIASAGNSTTFGSLTAALAYITGASNSTRALFVGGQTATNVLYIVTPNATGNTPNYTIAQTITIASTGNATTWANGLPPISQACSAASPLLFFMQGGMTTNGDTLNRGLFISFSSAGSYAVWSAVNQVQKAGCASSNCHGGL